MSFQSTKQARFTLISHTLCPFVQRAAIVLTEKQIQFKRVDIDLNNKPDWLLELSPLGKVPVLVTEDKTVIFESAVIAEYINEVAKGELLASDPLKRARQRSWIEFSSNLIFNIASLYNAEDKNAFDRALDGISRKLAIVDSNFSGERFFDGENISLVDISFAPALRYFAVLEATIGLPFYEELKRVPKWHATLLQRPSVVTAVQKEYPTQLLAFISHRESYLSDLITQQEFSASA